MRKTGPSKAVQDLVHARSGGLCERCGDSGGEQIHHRRPRGMGGTRRESTNLPSALLDLCQPCHAWVETTGRSNGESYRKGFLVRQAQDPAAVPVHYREGAAVYLGESGALSSCTHEDTLELRYGDYGDYLECADCGDQFNTDGGSL